MSTIETSAESPRSILGKSQESKSLHLATVLGVTLALAWSSATWADGRIEFPEEELAAESVYPVFDQPLAVKNRTIKTAKRIEASVYGGFFLNEPFYSPISFGGSATYHINETHGIVLYGAYYTRTLSNYAEQIKQPSVGNPQDYSLAPSPKYLAMGFYEWTPFYGKISMTKKKVFNLSTSFDVGAGMMGYGDENLLSVGGGVLQRFWFSKSWGLYADLKGLMYYGPNVVSKSLPPGSSSSVYPNSAFEKRFSLNFLFNLGAMFLF